VKDNLDLRHRFIEVFRVAAVQAGSVARRLQGKVCLEMKRGEDSPEGAALTAVDMAAQDVILHFLHRFIPDAAIDAEEDTETVSLFPTAAPDRPLIVIDPIDGTLNYSRASADYAVMGALLLSGFYEAALIYFPARGEMFWSIRGEGCRAWKEGGPDVPVHPNPPPQRVLITPWFPRSWSKMLRSAGFEEEVSRCSAVDASVAATGRAAASVSRGRPDRRRALGYLLTLEAGGAVRFGKETWRGEDPLNLPADRIRVAVAGTVAAVEKIDQLAFDEVRHSLDVDVIPGISE
jgi:fructose-1,6-bisphosphatase/inositol monophosphatase family enzyme